jgi:phospholipase C
MTVISPWTRGGWVNSQMFDHTSVLRFLEKRFGVMEPNISPWRRAVCGDLTSIFDFDVPLRMRRDTRWAAALPSVADYVAETERLCATAPPPVIANGQGVPVQEAGTRPARALPYRFAVEPSWSASGLTLRFVNEGPVGMVFGVQDEVAFPGWRYFTVAANSRLEESWVVPSDQPHALVVRGPNGFQRDYRGSGGSARVEAAWRDDGTSGVIQLRNRSVAPLAIAMHCAHSGSHREIVIAADSAAQIAIPSVDHRWYDLLLTGPGGVRLRLAGHVETGRPSISEPAARFPHPV